MFENKYNNNNYFITDYFFMSLFNDFIYFYLIDKRKNSYKFLLIKNIM